MRRVKYNKKRTLQPNYLEYSGEYSHVPISMQLFVYDEDSVQEYNDLTLFEMERVFNEAKPNTVKWFNLHGLHDVALLNEIGQFFQIENYLMAEILNFSRRSRMEELDEVLFFSVKSIHTIDENASIDIEQLSFILKDNVLLSFQEKKGNLFTIVRERIRTKVGNLRRKNSGYLLFALLESVMENFFINMDSLEDEIEMVLVESRITYRPNTLVIIERDSEQLNAIKRAILPLRDVLHNLKNQEDIRTISLIGKNNILYYSRLHYRALEVLDQVEYNLTKLDSATNYYFSAQNHRMNQIMKVLTIVSVIFMPLTFIVGVYGMNFENMPELRAENGYFITLSAMFFLVLLMVVYFRWKKWF